MNSGDFTYRGVKEKYVMEIPCHYLQFRLTATLKNRGQKATISVLE